MAYFCGECGEQLKSQRTKKGSTPTGTTKQISHKVLIVQTTRRYQCPNLCTLKTIKQS